MNEDLEKYITQHISEEPELLYKLNRDTNIHLVNGRMCSGHLQGRLLKMLVQMIRPSLVVELGTFSGYSALCIAEGLDDNASLITIDADDELEDRVRQWFARSPHNHKITLRIGDALEVARTLSDECCDLVFIDADKRQYYQYYEESMRLLRPGGFIIADNTLWDGHVLEDNPKSVQTAGIKKFNDFVANDPRSECVIIPLRDGLTLIRKNDLDS